MGVITITFFVMKNLNNFLGQSLVPDKTMTIIWNASIRGDCKYYRNKCQYDFECNVAFSVLDIPEKSFLDRYKTFPFFKSMTRSYQP